MYVRWLTAVFLNGLGSACKAEDGVDDDDDGTLFSYRPCNGEKENTQLSN